MLPFPPGCASLSLVQLRFKLSELNEPQREAVTTTEGPLLVLAGAGSGKTRVITYRIAYLLAQGVPPEAIVGVSFTNKAADEMRERVGRLVPVRTARALTLSTFHSLGLLILKAERRALGYPGGFTIYDTADQLGVIRDILRDARIEDRRLDVKTILFRISRVKNSGLSPEAFTEQLRTSRMVNEYDGYAAEVYPRYQAKMRAFHAMDFDDLLVETLRLVKDDEEVRARWQQRFRYLMIDEYQDTNKCQLDLLRLLCEPHRNLAVVGDDDQSIYGWRGAEASNILEFAQQFPGAKVVKLEENYRSTKPILDAANAVIAKNTKRHGKTLWTRKDRGSPLQLVVLDDAESEAKFVAEEIDLLRARHGYDLQDIAVLYRSNMQAKLIEEELRQAQIDYRMIGGQAFFDRKEVKDSIAYLKLLTHPRDEISLRRVINYPPRGVGQSTIDRLSAAQKLAGDKGHGDKGHGDKGGAAKGRGRRGDKEAAKDPGHAPLFDLVGAVASEEDRQGSLLDAGPRLGAAAQDLPQAVQEALGDIPKKTRGVLAGFMDLVNRHRASMLGGRGWREAAKGYLTEAGIFDDVIRAGPTALAAQRRLRNLEMFLDGLQRFEERTFQGETGEARGSGALELASYLHRLTLQTNDDDDDDVGGNRVVLSTLHGSKGLEFKVVFLVGLEEELLPHKKTLYPTETDLSEVAGPVDLSEERRLFYVGITRAREVLYLSWARVRGSRSMDRPRMASRFLEDVPPEVMVERDVAVGGSKGASDSFDEEAFAREMLTKMRKMTDA